MIPYLLTIMIAAIAYDSLVIHSNTWDRTIFGGIVASILLYFVKMPVERPLTIINDLTPSLILKKLTALFLIGDSTFKKIGTFIIDFVLFCVGTYLIRHFLPLPFISGSFLGWCVAVLFISVTIGFSIGFNDLTIQQDTSVENDWVLTQVGQAVSASTLWPSANYRWSSFEH